MSIVIFKTSVTKRQTDGWADRLVVRPPGTHAWIGRQLGMQLGMQLGR